MHPGLRHQEQRAAKLRSHGVRWDRAHWAHSSPALSPPSPPEELQGEPRKMGKALGGSLGSVLQSSPTRNVDSSSCGTQGTAETESCQLPPAGCRQPWAMESPEHGATSASLLQVEGQAFVPLPQGRLVDKFYCGETLEQRCQ